MSDPDSASGHLTEKPSLEGHGRRKFISNVAWLLSGEVAGRGLALLTQVALARLLGPQTFGLFSLSWIAAFTLGTVALMGTRGALVRYGARAWPRADEVQSIFRKCLVIAAMAGVFLGGLLWFGSESISVTVFNEPELGAALRPLSLLILLVPLLFLMEGVLRVSQKMYLAIIPLNLVQPGVYFVMTLTLIYLFDFGLHGAVSASLIGYTSGILMAFILITRLYGIAVFSLSNEGPSLGEILRYSFPVAVSGLLLMANLFLDRFLVGVFLTAREVGLYQAASQIGILLLILYGVFGRAVEPSLASLWHSGNKEALSKALEASVTWPLFLNFPVALVMVILSPAVVIGLYGDHYADAVLPMVILVATHWIHFSVAGMMLVIAERQRLVMAISLLSLLLNLMISVVLTPRIGMSGAAIGTGCAQLFYSFSVMLMLKHHHGLSVIRSKVVWSGALAAGLAVPGVFVVSLLMEGNSLWSVLAGLVVSSALFFGALAFIGREHIDWKTMQALIAKRIS